MPEPPPASSDESSVALPAQVANETRTTAQATVDTTTEAPKIETITATEPTPSTATPTQADNATNTALPPIPLGALPPSVLLSYKLTGQEKGLNYFANGELRWQHNEAAYALSLSVKAFLVGSRHWRSVGEINETGLAPRRFQTAGATNVQPTLTAPTSAWYSATTRPSPCWKPVPKTNQPLRAAGRRHGGSPPAL